MYEVSDYSLIANENLAVFIPPDFFRRSTKRGATSIASGLFISCWFCDRPKTPDKLLAEPFQLENAKYSNEGTQMLGVAGMHTLSL